jgi:hypothetical protein
MIKKFEYVYYNVMLNPLMLKRINNANNVHEDFPTDHVRKGFIEATLKEQKIRNKTRGTCAIDRTGEYQFQYNTVGQTMLPFEWFDQSGSIVDSQWCLENLLVERASKIKNQDKEVQFFWSGGVDSTTALAILKDVCPDQLMIQMTPSSIEENPRLYESLVKNLKHDIHEGDDVYSTANPDKYLVVECGAADALYGSMGGDHLHGDKTRIWRLRNRFGRASRRFRFFQNWNKDTINLDNIWPFYETPQIEQWFINRLIEGDIEPFDRDDVENYPKQKLAFRKIIEKWTGDSEYAWNKTGEWSIRANQSTIRDLRESGSAKDAYKLLAITSDGKCVNRENFRNKAVFPYLNTQYFPELKVWKKNNKGMGLVLGKK